VIVICQVKFISSSNDENKNNCRHKTLLQRCIPYSNHKVTHTNTKVFPVNMDQSVFPFDFLPAASKTRVF